MNYKRKTLLTIIAVFIGGFIGSAQASDVYFFAEMSGIIAPSGTTYPFCGIESCIYENPNNLELSFNDTPDVFDIKKIGDTNISYDFSGTGELSASSSNGNILLDDNISISSNTVQISGFENKGETTIVLTLKEDGKVVNQAFMPLLVIDESSAFVTTWEVNDGEQVIMPTAYSGYEYRGAISWDGGNTYSAFDSASDSSFTHDYASAGTYTAIVDGTFEAMQVNTELFMGPICIMSPPANCTLQGMMSTKIKTVENLGVVEWKNLSWAFKGSPLLESFKVGIADTSNVTNMSFMFGNSALTNLDLSLLDVSSVRRVQQMFLDMGDVNLNVSGWNTSNIIYMPSMFAFSQFSNLDLSGWDISNVTDMSYIFSYNDNLNNLNISGWSYSSSANDDFITNQNDYNLIYNEGVSSEVYRNLLSYLQNNCKSTGVDLDRGKNVCDPLDTVCTNARDALIDKDWTGLN